MDIRSWLVLIARMPAEPARHRMGLWRELRRLGAVPLGQGSWALPDLPATTQAVAGLRQRAAAGAGSLLVLTAHGHEDPDIAHLEQLYREAREQDWAEFVADCDKYLAELDKEHRQGKYTLAELDEEDHSLDRLRRWYRDLRARDLLGSTAAGDADQRLKQCADAFDDYADRVYATLGQPGHPPPGS